MDAVAGFVVAMIAVLMFLVAVMAGKDMASNGWERDCEKMGMHYEGGKVYQCKPDARQPAN